MQKNIPDKATCRQLHYLEQYLNIALADHWQRLKHPTQNTQAINCEALRDHLDFFKKQSLPKLSNKMMYGYHITSDLLITGASIAVLALALAIPFTATGPGAFVVMAALLIVGAVGTALYGYSLYQNARFACGSQVKAVEQLVDMIEGPKPQL